MSTPISLIHSGDSALFPPKGKPRKICTRYAYPTISASAELDEAPDADPMTMDLLDALGIERVHLFGISKGSLVGQAFLIRHRERAKSFCGLGNPHVLAHDLEPISAFQERISALEDLKDLWPQRINRRNCTRIFDHVYVPMLFSKQYAELTPLERLKVALLHRKLCPLLEGTFVQTMVDLFRYYVSDIAQEVDAFAAGLPQITGLPILLMNGTADTTTPISICEDMVSRLKQKGVEARLVALKDMEHGFGYKLRNRQQWQAARETLEFLKTHLVKDH